MKTPSGKCETGKFGSDYWVCFQAKYFLTVGKNVMTLGDVSNERPFLVEGQ
jgi:hypothetical protein